MSLAGARYFITICARRPEDRLVQPSVAGAITSALERMERDGDADLVAYTVMPDHVHLLASLTGRLSLSRLVGKFKALTELAMRAGCLQWQENFFDHRLRPEDRTGDYALYVFLNPYRAGLICHDEVWPWWRKSAVHDFDFVSMLDSGRYPPRAWIDAEPSAQGVSVDTVGCD